MTKTKSRSIDIIYLADKARFLHLLTDWFVAMDNDGTPLGTIALEANSVGSETAAGPWLAAFLVDPDRGKQGLGSRLIEGVENEAQRLGFTEIFTSTDSGQQLLERRNWSVWGQAISLRGPIPIYRKCL